MDDLLGFDARVATLRAYLVQHSQFGWMEERPGGSADD
jgi:hypothetical protein